MPHEGMDSVATAKHTLGGNRAFEVLWQAQQYWLAMDTFRRDRKRNKTTPTDGSGMTTYV